MSECLKDVRARLQYQYICTGDIGFGAACLYLLLFSFLVACSFKLISLFPSIVDEKPMFGAQRKCSEQYICIIKASARTRVQFQCKSYF